MPNLQGNTDNEIAEEIARHYFQGTPSNSPEFSRNAGVYLDVLLEKGNEWRQKDIELANTVLRRLQENTGHLSASLLERKSQVHFHSQEYEKALDAMTQAISHAEDDVSRVKYQFLRAVLSEKLCERTGNKPQEEVIRGLNGFLERHGNHRRAQLIRKKLSATNNVFSMSNLFSKAPIQIMILVSVMCFLLTLLSKGYPILQGFFSIISLFTALLLLLNAPHDCVFPPVFSTSDIVYKKLPLPSYLEKIGMILPITEQILLER